MHIRTFGICQLAVPRKPFKIKMEAKKQYDYMIKIVVNGEDGVGKSSTIVRMARDEFQDGHMGQLIHAL